MDTNKIDWIMRTFVMAPFFGILAFSVLFPVFITIDAGYASADIGVFNIGTKKIHVQMDWILTTGIGIASAVLIIRQINQASLRDKERTKRALRKDFRNRVIAAAENIRLSETKEGYLYFEEEEIKYIVCWRHDEVSYRISQFNMMFCIMKRTDTEISTLENLCNTKDPNRWSFRILIPLFYGRYGTVSQSSASGRISNADMHLYDCILHAVGHIQILDGNEMKRCYDDFEESDLRGANDEYLRTNIFTRHLKVGEVGDIS